MKRPLSTLQTLTGSTRSEAIVILLLLGGLLVGYGADVWQRSTRTAWEDSRVAADIAAMLESADQRQNIADPPPDSSVPPFRSASRSVAPHPVNLNTASVADLTSLPGIGERTAEKIVERRKMRRFLTPEDIMDVRGIGQKKYERMRPFLRVQ